MASSHPPGSNRILPEAAVQVLLVEDEPLAAEQIESLLPGMDYEVVSPAPKAQIILALFHTEHVDLFLLNIDLGGPTDGLQLAEQLLTNRPVLLFS